MFTCLFLIFFLFLFVFGDDYDNPFQSKSISKRATCADIQCDPCRDGALKVDFLFLIDGSGSMQGEITAVSNGLSKFLDEVSAQSIDWKAWVVLIGGTPQLIVDGETSGTVLKSKFSKISATRGVSGLHNRAGGQEPSFEAIRMALGKARYNTFNTQQLKTWKPSTTGRIQRRPDAKTFVMLLTDEDSDKPYIASNYNKYSYVSPWNYGYDPRSWSYTNGPYAAELKDTVAAIGGDTYFYAFVGTASTSKKQFGDPACDSSNADFSNFDRVKTLDCLRRAGYGQSLVGQLLNGPTNARVLKVLDIEKSGVVDKFFATAVKDVSKCEMKRRRKRTNLFVEELEQQDQAGCVGFSCDASKYDGLSLESMCQISYTCASNCNQCMIGGTCYRAGQQKPGTPKSCYFCDPARSKTSWSLCSGFTDAPANCNKRVCYKDFATCQEEPVCDGSCNLCEIPDSNGYLTCQKAGWTKDERLCVTCDPAVNDKDWTDVCPVCNPDCQNGGVCTKGENGAADYCDCTETSFLGPTCTDLPVCSPACANGICLKETFLFQETCMEGGDPTKAVCKCNDGWEGADCSTCSDPVLCTTCAPDCQNGGRCVDMKCDCAGTGFSGDACDVKKLPKCDPPCLHGSCDLDTDQCVCNPNYYNPGKGCDHYARPGTPATGAACENRQGFVCTAIEEFGEVTEHLINCDEGAVSWEICTTDQQCNAATRTCDPKTDKPAGVVDWTTDETCKSHCLDLCDEENIITCACSSIDGSKWLECDVPATAGPSLVLPAAGLLLTALLAFL